MKYSQEKLAALISEVETAFAAHLAKTESEEVVDLKKSENESEEVEAQAQPETSEETIEKAEEEKEEQDFDYDEEDIQEMNKMYASMTKAEAAAHYESLKKALYGDEEVVEEKAEEVIEKSEEPTEKVEDSKEETALLKSELEAKDKEIAELKKSFEGLTAALTKFVKGSKAPKQKAITQIEYIQKSEEESKVEENKEDVTKLPSSEVSKRLNEKIRSGKLEKAEREKINEYYLTGSQNIESIRHLL